jgi:hypothetical protein
MSCLHRSPYLRVWSCLRWFNTHLSFVFGMLYLSSRQMNSTILTCCRIIRMHLIVLWVVLQGTLNLKTCQKLMWPIFVMNWAWDFLEIRDSVWCKVDGGQKYSIQLNLYAFYCIIISVFFLTNAGLGLTKCITDCNWIVWLCHDIIRDISPSQNQGYGK